MENGTTKMRLRTTSFARAMISEAAELRGMTISKFVVQAAVERSHDILDSKENYAFRSKLNAKLFAFLDDDDRNTQKKNDSEPDMST